MNSLRKEFYRILSRLRSWLGSVARRGRLEHEMDSELATHLDLLTADLIRDGYTHSEARRRARIALGSMVAHKAGMRASLGLRLVDEMAGDLHYAARRLRHSVGFTAVAAISLAMAIGANTAIFSLAKQLLYERLAVPRASDLRLLAWIGPEENVAVHSTWGDYMHLPGGRVTSSSLSYPVYQQLRSQNKTMEDLFAFKLTGMNATIQGTAQAVQVEMVSGNYYAGLGIIPVLGRPIVPSDDATAGQGAVAVISYGLWEQQFSRSPQVLGQMVKVNDIPLTIVGVNPRGFTGAAYVQQSPEIFVPLSMQPLVSPQPGSDSLLTDQELWWVNVMGRVRPGASGTAAQTVLNGPFRADARATLNPKTNEVIPQLDLRDGSRGAFTQEAQFAKPMAVLLTMVGFVLLLACANIANLMLARGAQRRREISVRMALGAGRARIARQMLVESLLLAVLGGTGGVLVGYIGSNLLPKLMENAWDRNGVHIHFDWQIFAFTAVITILTGVLFGLAPAFAAARNTVSSDLKESSQNVTRRRKGWGGRSLVGFQIALSTLLVIGASLFLRTLAGLSTIDVGFRTDHLLLVNINPPAKFYPPGKDVAVHQRIEEAFAAIAGVSSVSPANVPYIANSRGQSTFLTEDEVSDKKKHTSEYFNVVGNNFFQTMRIPILAGRSFDSRDTATSLKVGIINASLARKRFPNQNPIGKRFTNHVGPDRYGNQQKTEWMQIIGVCADTRYSSLRDEPPPQYFLPYVQRERVGGMVYEIRSQLSTEALVPALREAVRRIDPDLPLVSIRTQEQQIADETQLERTFVTLTSGFGILALALASVGIYGVMAYSVASRTNEIGIRLALGAMRQQVLTMVLREAAWISFTGIAVGLVAAMALARLVKSMLYGLQPSDPLSLIAGAAILVAVGFAASWLPARRAALIEPMEVLRCE